MIYIGADHAGFQLKETIKEYLSQLGHEHKDLGNHIEDNNDDYPDFGIAVAQKVAEENAKGILICGTGMGMCIVANKIKGIRAVLCYNEYMAEQARTHNDSNILCLAGRAVDTELAKGIVKAWLGTKFSGEDRHLRRINKIKALEK